MRQRVDSCLAVDLYFDAAALPISAVETSGHVPRGLYIHNMPVATHWSQMRVKDYIE